VVTVDGTELQRCCHGARGLAERHPKSGVMKDKEACHG
jgi:hypothetical protein